MFFFFKQKTAYEIKECDWSSDVCLPISRYGSPALKKVASLLSIATMFGIVIGQIIASRALLEGLGITSEFIFLAFWAFIITYTILGGLKAVAFKIGRASCRERV